jgi:cold shock CspA family protein
MPQGTIHGLQIARGLGFLRPDDGGADLLFRRSAPDPDDPARLLAVRLQLVAE